MRRTIIHEMRDAKNAKFWRPSRRCGEGGTIGAYVHKSHGMCCDCNVRAALVILPVKWRICGIAYSPFNRYRESSMDNKDDDAFAK